MEFDGLSNRVIGCAIEVHRALGPGLLESAYEQCLAHEPRQNEIQFKLRRNQAIRAVMPDLRALRALRGSSLP